MANQIGGRERCKMPCGCCPIVDLTPNTCTGNGQIGHRRREYGQIGFSPCGKYVAHESNSPCTVIDGLTINSGVIDLTDCHCRTESCPCGDFVSHLISEPCTAR
jgi:hypothetical protein